MINLAKFNIFVNVYVHWPEVYNGTTIEERLNKYFRKYFIESSTYIKFYTAPINENQIIGKVIFTLDNKYIGEVDLITENSVNKKENKDYINYVNDK